MKRFSLLLSAMLLACTTSLLATQYKLVTSTDDLEAGANYIIGSAATNSAVFMSTTDNTNNRKQSAAVTITNSEIALADDILVLKLGGSTGSWTFATTNYKGTAGYLNATSTTNSNYLKVVAADDKYNKFTITFDKNNAAVITCTGKTSRNIMMYNSSNTTNGQLFSCYSSGQSAVYLYKEVSSANLQSIEIAGEPTKTTYMAGDVFSTDGLKVMGTYEGDDTQKEITTGITWEVTPATLTAGLTSVEVKATVGGKSTTRTITGLTVTAAKTLTSIAVSGTPAEFWKGDTFHHDGMTVTATWDDTSTTDVTAEAEFSTPDMTTAGVKTITVTYKEQTATYDITVKTIANTQETAYTVAEAIALIDAGKDLTATVFVKGTISKIDNYNSTNKSITYWLDNDAFEVYSGKGLGNTDFSSINDIAKGGEVIVCGNIKKYSSTYEFDKNNYLVAYTAPAVVKSVATITLTGNKYTLEAGADDEYTVTYDGDGVLSVVSSDEAVAEARIVDGTVLVSAKAVGKTTITFSAPETENYLAAEKTYTLTISAPWAAAALPFEFNSGVADIPLTTGIKQVGLGSDYKSAPYLKFDDAKDSLLIWYNDKANTLAYTTKGNSFSGGTFDVKESTDGVNFSIVESITNLGTDATDKKNTLKEASRFVLFTYTTKSSGNVALGGIKISYVSNPTAIESAVVETPAVKVIENGQLVLIRDGVKYNAMGVRL